MINGLKFFLIFMIITLTKAQLDDGYNYANWKFHFPSGSGIGLFLAVALPLDLPHRSAYLSYNFEANYGLPDNQTYLEYPPLIQKRIDRQLVYNAIEMKMQSNGYAGRDCLLRTICEISLNSIEHANGILGDILHIIFTPSTSTNNELESEYEEAERQGTKQLNCKKYEKNCKTSFLDLISWLEHSV